MRLPGDVRLEFDSSINGIPCRVQARILYGYDGGFYEPPFETEVYLTVLDRSGRPAPWLERMLDQDEINRLENEALEEDAARSIY